MTLNNDQKRVQAKYYNLSNLTVKFELLGKTCHEFIFIILSNTGLFVTTDLGILTSWLKTCLIGHSDLNLDLRQQKYQLSNQLIPECKIWRNSLTTFLSYCVDMRDTSHKIRLPGSKTLLSFCILGPISHTTGFCSWIGQLPVKHSRNLNRN